MDKKVRHDRILDCRYYNGEEVAPKDVIHLFWGYEHGWVNGINQNWETEREDIKRLGLWNWLYNNDGTPPDFKCLLFNRYCHWNGLYGKTDEFLRWYNDSYVLPRLTNRQRRYLLRKEKLLKQCKFYKGEECCPFSNEKDEHFWKYEMVWVDKLAQSYTYADNWREELVPYKKIQALVKEYGLSSSFIGLLVNRDLHWLGMIDEHNFIKSIQRDYLKVKD